MACCKCCCEQGNPTGVCCGEAPNDSCCKEPDVCCGGKACCGETDVCCAEQGRCCLEGQTCCGEENCCDEGTVCCGDTDCCPPEECCVDGECVPCDCDPPCTEDNCETCVEDPPGTFSCQSSCEEWQVCCNGVCKECCTDLDCAVGQVCCDGTCGECQETTTCPTNEVLCVEYTFAGADCNQSVVGVSFFSEVGQLAFRPCGTNAPDYTVRQYPCGGGGDAFDIKGSASCASVVYDSECGCTASDCDWVDAVAEWANLGGTQCDCELVLVGYSVYQTGGSCP